MTVKGPVVLNNQFFSPTPHDLVKELLQENFGINEEGDDHPHILNYGIEKIFEMRSGQGTQKKPGGSDPPGKLKKEANSPAFERNSEQNVGRYLSSFHIKTFYSCALSHEV